MSLPDINWRHLLSAGLVLLVLLIVLSIAPELYTTLHPEKGRVAIIQLDGPITYSTDIRSPGITPQHIASITERAKNDQSDVMIFEINSPGGSVVASKDAARVIKNVDTPTICLIKEVAASGAYWIASSCDRIVADSLSLTGSIGVTSAYLEFSELLNRFGVEYVNLTSGKYKDMGSRYRNITPAEEEKFQDILDTVHAEFVQQIAENREMEVETVQELATGEVFLGREAHSAGLVDTLGSREHALEIAKELTNVTELKEKTYKPPQRLDVVSLLFSSIGEGIVHGLKNQQLYGLQSRY